MADGQTGTGEIPPSESEWAEVTDPAWKVEFDKREAAPVADFQRPVPTLPASDQFHRAQSPAGRGRRKSTPGSRDVYHVLRMRTLTQRASRRGL